MRETDATGPENRPNAEDDAQYQPPRLSPEEIERLEAEEELEDFSAETPQGDLSVISDENVPGRPG